MPTYDITFRSGVTVTVELDSMTVSRNQLGQVTHVMWEPEERIVRCQIDDVDIIVKRADL